MDDEINEEIRAIRRKLAAEQGNDLAKIMADLRAREATDGRVYVSFPKRTPRQIAPPLISTPPAVDPSNALTESN
jgi:hypothetical protein